MCMTDFFEYDNCKYPYKTIYFQNDNCSYIIATENLELKLLPDGENYDSGLAQKIDDRIFFFVPEKIFSQNDRQVIKFIEENI